jgi:hypothetical protein
MKTAKFKMNAVERRCSNCKKQIANRYMYNKHRRSMKYVACYHGDWERCDDQLINVGGGGGQRGGISDGQIHSLGPASPDLNSSSGGDVEVPPVSRLDIDEDDAIRAERLLAEKVNADETAAILKHLALCKLTEWQANQFSGLKSEMELLVLEFVYKWALTLSAGDDLIKLLKMLTPQDGGRKKPVCAECERKKPEAEHAPVETSDKLLDMVISLPKHVRTIRERVIERLKKNAIKGDGIRMREVQVAIPKALCKDAHEHGVEEVTVFWHDFDAWLESLPLKFAVEDSVLGTEEGILDEIQSGSVMQKAQVDVTAKFGEGVTACGVVYFNDEAQTGKGLRNNNPVSLTLSILKRAARSTLSGKFLATYMPKATIAGK